MSPGELLGEVKDKESFEKFLDALIADREDAEKLEMEHPKYYQLGGANNWQNSSISGFLESASVYLMEGPHRHKGTDFSWNDLAKFLYFGKVYE